MISFEGKSSYYIKDTLFCYFYFENIELSYRIPLKVEFSAYEIGRQTSGIRIVFENLNSNASRCSFEFQKLLINKRFRMYLLND